MTLPFFFNYFARHSDDPKNQPDSHTDCLVDIKGFNYTINRSGHTALTVKADRLTIKKQKIGHISIGGFAGVRLKNAVVQVYGMPPEATKHEVSQSNKMSLDQVLTGIEMPFPSVKRILSIKMAPIRVELCNQDTVATRISASSASIRSKKGDMVFEKGVIVVSGPRTLETERLSISPDISVVKVFGNFVLTTPDGRYKGNRLTTDINLIPFRTAGKIN